jgi:hypothetical protein
MLWRIAADASVISIFKALTRVALTLWLATVVLVHFVAPLYLLAIYPRMPEGRVGRYGMSITSPGMENFWVRLLMCGVFVALGLLIVRATLRAIEKRPPRRGRASA